MDVVALAGWNLLLVSSLIGWGELLRVLLRLHKCRNYIGINILLGCAAATGVGGLGIAVGIAGRTFWTLLVVTGAVILLVLCRPFSRLVAVARRDRLGLISGIATAGVVFSVSVGNLLQRPLSPYDDEPAYFYLAKRLWSLGDLHDPFNSRRLQSHGGSTFLQMIGMGPLSDNAFNSFDEFVGASLLLSLVFVIRGRSQRVWTALLLIVVISYHSERGGGTSMTSLFFTAVYTVVVHEVLTNWDSPRAFKVHLIQFQVLVLAVLTLMRPFAGVVLGMFLLWQIVSWRLVKPTWITIRFSASTLALLAPWMILQFRDSGTPFFPILPGVSSRIFTLGGDRSMVQMVPYLVDSALELVTSGAIPWLAACAVMLTFTLGLPRPAGLMKSVQWSYLVLVCAIPVYTLALAYTIAHWGTPLHWTRYWSPIVIGSGLVAVVMTSEQRSKSHRKRFIVYVSQAALIFGGYTALPHAAVIAVASDVVGMTSGRYEREIPLDQFADHRSDYEVVRRAIPPGSVLLSAVQLPHLLLGDNFTVFTADFPGAAVPHGEFPWGETYAAKARWLRNQQIDYLLVHSRDAGSIFYSYEELKEWLKRDSADGVIARYMLEWLDFTYELTAATEPVATSGDLVLISVDRLR